MDAYIRGDIEMKVFFYSHTLRPGGAEKQCALVAAELKRVCGLDTVVVLNDGDGIKQQYQNYLDSARVPIVILPKRFFPRVCALWRIFSHERNSVLFNYLTYPDFVGGCVARLAGLNKIIGGIETDELHGLKLIAEYISNHLFSTQTICNSYRAYEFFKSRGLDDRKMIVMPSGIEFLDDTFESCDKKTDTVQIVTIGRFVWQKDYDSWIKTIAKVYGVRKNIRAKIIGYGELETHVKSLIAEYNLNEVVKIIPGENADILNELRTSDIYLSTSVREGTSNTILEAMNCSLPVIATDVGDNTHMVLHGENGFIHQSRSIDDLAESLIKLIDDANLRMSMGASSKRRILEEYSIDVIVGKYSTLINA